MTIHFLQEVEFSADAVAKSRQQEQLRERAFAIAQASSLIERRQESARPI